MDGQLRVLAPGRATRTGERLVFDDPELVAVVERELLVGANVLGGEEGDARELEVLVVDVDLHRDQIRLARVVHEAGDVAVASSVDAVRLSFLQRPAVESVSIFPFLQVSFQFQ